MSAPESSASGLGDTAEMDRFGGVITAMATAFGSDGAIDLTATRRIARHLVEHGSHGVVVAGTTGESPTLDDHEKLALLVAVLDEVGDEATVICGTGSNDTAHSVKLTAAACAAGAHGALVVTPYYNRPSPAGVEAHFRAVAEAAGSTPVVLYNIPGRCGVNVEPGLLTRLGADVTNVIAVKQANDDQLDPVPGLTLLAGNDDTFLRCLKSGGKGGILVASHIVGESLRELWESFEAGDIERAEAIDQSLRPVYSALSVATNPIPLKYALSRIGLCPERMRLPLVPLEPSQHELIDAELNRQGLLAVPKGV